MAFTLFYDGQCPLCAMEVKHLQKRDEASAIIFEDIMRDDFAVRFPDADWDAMNKKIHGQLEDGTWLTGLDVTHEAWSRVGKGWLYAPLRWPVIRWFADKVYLLFAKYRHQIAFLLTGKKRCNNNCSIKY